MNNSTVLAAVTVGVMVVIVAASLMVLPSNFGNKSTTDTSCPSVSSSSSSTNTSRSSEILSPLGVFYTGSGSTDFAFGPGGGTLYIADQNSGTVFETNTTGYPITNISVGSSPQNIVYVPTLRAFYVTTLNSVVAINASTNKVYQNITASYPSSVLYVPDTSQLYVGLVTNKTDIFDASSGHLVKTINNTIAPFSIAYDPTNQLVYEENWTSTLVFNNTNQIVDTIPSVSGNILYDPNNDRIYVASYNGSIFVIYPSTNQEILKFNVSPYIKDMAFDSQNNSVYFITGYPGYIGYFSDYNNSVDGISSIVTTVGSSDYLTAIRYNPTNNLLFAVSYQNDKGYVISPYLIGTGNASYSSTFSTTCGAMTSLPYGSTTTAGSESQIVFYVEVFYNANWSGSYSYQAASSGQATYETFSGKGFDNQTVVFYGNLSDGLCVSATAQKQDASNSLISLQIYSATFNASSQNKTSVPYGSVSANFCVTP
jgi:hypothetical protein